MPASGGAAAGAGRRRAGGGLLSGLEATGLMSLGSEESVQMLLILLCYSLDYFLLLFVFTTYIRSNGSMFYLGGKVAVRRVFEKEN